MTETLVAALLEPFADPASRTFLPALVGSAAIAALFLAVRRGRIGWREVLPPEIWAHRSTRVDVQLLIVRQLLSVLIVAPRFFGAWALAVALVRGLDRAVGVPATFEVPLPLLGAAYTLVLFVAWDASRYALHRAMHGLGPLWQIHQVHHSAEVLTPLTFHRVHPVESALYAVRGVLVTGTVAGLAFWLFRGTAVEGTLLGVNALGLVCNAATGNLRHSHVWMRFPPAVERWLLSPAQHQLHHGRDPANQASNLGTWLACWDRWAGTLALAPDLPPAVGLRAEDRNHAPDDLLSALAGPMRAAVAGPTRVTRRCPGLPSQLDGAV